MKVKNKIKTLLIISYYKSIRKGKWICLTININFYNLCLKNMLNLLQRKKKKIKELKISMS